VNLIFSLSPKHSDAYYAQKAREAAELDVFRICLKDPGALLTPERLRTLIPAIQANVKDVPLEFHTHCNTGLGAQCSLEAIKLGIRIINAAIPPLAESSSNPSLFDVARNARTIGFKTTVDEESLKPVEAHFRSIALREGFPIGAPASYDEFHYVHQVPGGMISNLRFQLGTMGLADKLPAVLEEIARVRADLGYPVMVTPYSQFTGVQAVMNVVAGERYKVVADEIIQYALGLWGEDERDSMEQNARDKILARERSKELARWVPEQPSLAEIRRTLGGPGVSDDDLLLRYFSDAQQVAQMRAAGGVQMDDASSLARLLEKVKNAKNVSLVSVRIGDASITVGRNIAG
jgi:oxaloacetate decarboxylase alpha subunit